MRNNDIVIIKDESSIVSNKAYMVVNTNRNIPVVTLSGVLEDSYEANLVLSHLDIILSKSKPEDGILSLATLNVIEINCVSSKGGCGSISKRKTITNLKDKINKIEYSKKHSGKKDKIIADIEQLRAEVIILEKAKVISKENTDPSKFLKDIENNFFKHYYEPNGNSYYNNKFRLCKHRPDFSSLKSNKIIAEVLRYCLIRNLKGKINKVRLPYGTNKEIA